MYECFLRKNIKLIDKAISGYLPSRHAAVSGSSMKFVMVARVSLP